MTVNEYREYINPVTAVVKRKRFDLTERGLENSFLAGKIHIEDIESTYVPEELLSYSDPKIKVKKSKLPDKASREINHGESVTDRELAGTKHSEAEKVQLHLQEPLILTTIAITDDNLESEREVEVDTGVTIVPSIVTETPEVIEQTRNVTNERQSVVKKPAIEAEQRVPKQKVAPHVVRKDNEQLERDRLEQQSLELAKKLTERERLEKLKKDELEQQSLTLAMQLAEEERISLEHTSPSKKEESDYWSKSSGSGSYITPKSAIELQQKEEARLEEERLAKLEAAKQLAEQEARLEAARQLAEQEARREAELLKQQQEEEARLEEAIAAAELAIVRLETAKKLR